MEETSRSADASSGRASLLPLFPLNANPLSFARFRLHSGVNLANRISVPSLDTALISTLRDVLAPLIEADGGELYVLADPPESKGAVPPVRLHLGGRFAGCPGNALVSEHIIKPTLAAVTGSRDVQVSSGRLIPPGAERMRPSTRD